MNGHIVVLGGGVMGLSIAYQMQKEGWRVTLVDRMMERRNASWASAGVLLPSSPHRSLHPMDQICALGTAIHRRWATELHETTGIDNGLRFDGGFYVARSNGEAGALAGLEQHWLDEGIEFESIPLDQVSLRFPGVAHPQLRRATWVPSEGQIRSPRHLHALRSAICRQPGNSIYAGQAIGLVIDENRIRGVEVDGRLVEADIVCVAAGAWTGELLKPLALQLPTTPVRGQMILYRLLQPAIKCVINEGPRYIVPRDDGHVLVGSTMEEVGFDDSTTQPALVELRSFAETLLPTLAASTPIASWAGLRPASFDGLPYLGRLPGLANGFVATGLFRIGFQASPAAALVIADLVANRPLSVDISQFRPNRVFAV
jgi:glycine oxidase